MLAKSTLYYLDISKVSKLISMKKIPIRFNLIVILASLVAAKCINLKFHTAFIWDFEIVYDAYCLSDPIKLGYFGILRYP